MFRLGVKPDAVVGQWDVDIERAPAARPAGASAGAGGAGGSRGGPAGRQQQQQAGGAGDFGRAPSMPEKNR